MLKFSFRKLLAFTGVTLIILLCYCPYLFVYFPSISPAMPLTAATMLGALTFHAGIIAWALFYAVFSEPGGVEETASLDPAEIEALKAESRTVRKRLEEAKSRGGKNDVDLIYREQLPRRSYCFACKTVRPVRAHHCKTCHRCVLRMDHHCPWTGNCIGQNNHAHFLRFLFHASSGMLFHYALAAALFFPFERRVQKELQWWIIFGNITWSLGCGAAIGYLFLYQWRNALVNVTTIEEHIPGVLQSPPFARATPRENLEQIFGKNYTFLTLLLPGRSIELEDDFAEERGHLRV